MRKLLHIGSTSAIDGQSTTVGELTRFLDQPRRLPELASGYKYHRDYLHAQGSSSLQQAVYWIGQHLNIVDPTIKFQLPSDAISLVKGLIHQFRARQSTLKAAYNAVANALDDSAATTFLNASVASGWKDAKNKDLSWFMLGLYEHELPLIRHHPLLTMFDPDPARDFRFYADIRYALVIFTGKGRPPARPPTWIDLDAYRRGGGGALAAGKGLDERWFKVGQYVDDASAQKWMAHETRDHYMRITGRAAGFSDSYWHLSGWERFKEGAKAVGDAVGTVALKVGPTIVKNMVGGGGGHVSTGSPSGIPSRWQEQRLMDSGAGDSAAGPGTYARALWHGHTTDFNRKSIVPPGYCFVKFNGHLSVAVVRTDSV
jgi:hypothetical protein